MGRYRGFSIFIIYHVFWGIVSVRGGIKGEFISGRCGRRLSPLEGVADKPTKRKEAALPAVAVLGATWLGSEGETSPFVLLIKNS